jgi:hypothetical protein
MEPFLLYIITLTLLSTHISGCALRGQVNDRSSRTTKPVVVEARPATRPLPKKEQIILPGEQVPVVYALAMRPLFYCDAVEAISDSLSAAFEILEREVGTDQAIDITAHDPMYLNELALVAAKRMNMAEALAYLEKAWEGLHRKAPTTADSPFRTPLFHLNGRIYDTSPDMDTQKDQAIMKAFRDFVFLNKRSERYFLDQVMRRNHRFLPEPVIFPGYFGSIAIEVVNDWYHRTHKTDLMSWRRFTHLPIRYTDGNIRQTQRALAANMLFIGILQGDERVVKHALKRLDQSMPKSGGVYRHVYHSEEASTAGIDFWGSGYALDWMRKNGVGAA